MRFEHSYYGSSAADVGPSLAALSFAPDLKREPTYFEGTLRAPLGFREAISSLHEIVVADARPRGVSAAYEAWRDARESIYSGELTNELQVLCRQLTPLFLAYERRMVPLEQEVTALWRVVYAWCDPVITVHPDELFFECFSKDESSYGRLGVRYDVFDEPESFSCGTTNVDYSRALYDEFQKIRSYKTTRFSIDPSGFEVATGDSALREVKIDLPDSWVRGFLQVNSAMTLPARVVTLHPMDVYNLCSALRQRREREGPRSLRFLLEPGRPVRLLLDPWQREIVCRRSVYEGDEPDEIRIWGRRRLHVLERLIPIARSFRVHLLGRGMPSFWIADLGPLTFTLGLSGWTANEWSGASQLDLLAPRRDLDGLTRERVYRALKADWLATPAQLADKTGLERAVVRSALASWAQAGRAMFDLGRGVYRARELTREPLAVDGLRFASEREAVAARHLERGGVVLDDRTTREDGTLRLCGSVSDGGQQTARATLTLDADESVCDARCSCAFYRNNRLHRGPCEHMLALRMLHQRASQMSGHSVGLQSLAAT